MYVNLDNISKYLIKNELLSKQTVVAGTLSVVDMSKKNRNLKVLQNNDSNYLIKQPFEGDVFSSLSVAREGKFYSVIESESSLHNLKKTIPALIKNDVTNNIVITRFIENKGTLNHYDSNSDPDYAHYISDFASQIANFHKESYAHVGNSGLSFLPKSFPLVLYVVHPIPELFTFFSPYNLELLKTFQQDPDIAQLFSGLRQGWKVQTLIHGDLKLENVLIGQDGSIKIIDWELISLGDPAWDVANVLHDFIYTGIFSFQFDDDDFENYFKNFLEYVMPQLSIFCSSYSSSVRLEDLSDVLFFERSLKYTVAKLLQSAFDLLQWSTEYREYSDLIVSVSAMLLGNSKEITESITSGGQKD